MDYPVLDVIDQLKDALLKNTRVILQAPPGAGKSTVVPLKLLDEAWLSGKKIIMLEPRRLAAKSVALRMADLQNENIGQAIGYRVRFESKVSKSTRIEVVTEGILTRMIQSDNSLEDVGLIIFDEFHERSLQADLALALSLQVQQILRDDLRILVMSATLDSEKISSFLQAPVITSSGRQFPVDIRYQSAPDDDYLPLQMSRAIKRAFFDNKGDILAFFPGAGEITRTAEQLERENIGALVLPLYGDLSFAKQQEAILPNSNGVRKIVLATAIAETSLTIEGITVVVDCGYSRVPKFDPSSGLSRLQTVRVTKDAADQRAGRAGRLGPGTCYRLWTQGVQLNLSPQRQPEILEADLAPLLLELFQWGIKDVRQLSWLTMPPPGAVAQAKDLLEQLGAIENDQITARGKQMLNFPTHPRIAHMLLELSGNRKDSALAADVAALLEERDPMSKESGADLSLRVALLRKWRSGERVNADRNAMERIEKLSAQWRKILNTEADNNSINDWDTGICVMSAYPERIARQLDKHGERYKLFNGRLVKLPQHDPLSRESWLAVAQLDAGSGEGKVFLAAPLDEKDLQSMAREVETVRWDDDRGMVVAALEKRVGNLVLSSKPSHKINEEERLKVLCAAIREKGLRILNWSEDFSAWQARVMSLKKWRAEEEWPDVSEEYLLATSEAWLNPFLVNISKRSELEKLDMKAILDSILGWELQNKFERLAPERISVPSGSNIKLIYSADGASPIMEVRLQEVFGMLETPTVNEGRIKIVLHLLSPGFKPVQVTQDLKSFWSGTYAEVRKELRTRYPKHSWPEDPWTAQAIRGAKRRT